MRVLIADDNPDLTRSLAMLLREWDFESVTVHDGDSALAVLREAEVPMLALLDWMMPGVNGIDICRAIRANTERPYSYILLMTGRGDKTQMLDGLKAGADDYLIKPVDPNELQARLNTGQRILELQEQLLTSQRCLREQATRDSLTGLTNHAMILEILQRELSRSRRDNQPLSIVMADLDHFKNVNDTHGHLVGDQVLRQVAQLLLGALRPYDTIGRYGGEEFLGVFPNCGAEASMALAGRLRRCVEATPINADGVIVSATLSLGVATWDGSASSQELLRAADVAMYRAKTQGRNQVLAAFS